MSKLFVTIAFFSLSSTAFSQGISMTAGAKRELILSGESCAQLIAQRDALCEWKKRDEPGFFSTKEAYKCTVVNNKAKLAILNCLPTFARDYHLKKLVNSGGNCWGTAMSFKKLSLKPRFVWPEEIDYWMSGSVCRKLEVNEKKLPGDIINVFGPEYLMKSELTENDMGTRYRDALFPTRFKPAREEGYTGYHRLLHSVTYVTEEMAFGKDSPSKDDKFIFHPMDEVYGRPNEKDCQENQALTPHMREYNNQPQEIRGSKCAYFSTVHRCSNLNTVFADTDSDLLTTIKSLQKIQEKIFPLVVSLNPVITKAEALQIVAKADEVMKITQLELKESNIEKNREMLLTLQYFTAAGLRKSLEQARMIPATEPL